MRGTEENKAGAVAGKTLTANFGGLNLILLQKTLSRGVIQKNLFGSHEREKTGVGVWLLQ